MSTPSGLVISLSYAKENAGIAARCRGFLTKYGGEMDVLARDAKQAVIPSKGRCAPWKRREV